MPTSSAQRAGAGRACGANAASKPIVAMATRCLFLTLRSFDQQVFALGCDADFEFRSAPGDVVAQIFENHDKLRISALRSMVKELEALHARFFRQLHSLCETAVAPSLTPRILGIAEHCIMKQQIDATQEFDDL